MTRSMVVGDLSLLLPMEQDHDRDWIAVVLPAYKGQIQVTMKINFAHIKSAIEGFKTEKDVCAFMEAHRPWTSVFYDLWASS